MDTIVAIATPPGRSAIGVLRLSGPQALEILRSLVKDSAFNPEPHRLSLKQIFLPASSEALDLSLISYFKAPHSFSGEDMVEISCHGSPVVLRQLLDHVLQLNARIAGPGEFSLRACRNGKLNLSQAEAIRDLINARTAAAAQQATRQLRGELSVALQKCKDELIAVIVKLESALEFVEDDLPQLRSREMLAELCRVQSEVRELAATFSVGHLLREGLKVVLAGAPNAGKSSLFNKLVRFDRAIVTDLPGTTRDSLAETISLQGIPVSLVDTAGMREAGDRIEAIGIERTQQAMADADLVIVVIDGSSQLSDDDRSVLRAAEGSAHVVALNKSDLGHARETTSEADGPTVVHVSALTGAGLEDLIDAIVKPFAFADSSAAGLMITDSRHYDLLRRTESSLESSATLLKDGASEELVLVGLHSALKLLGEITGETTTEDILGQVFSTFCIGK
jgi:tRNA modification GTPase